MKNTFSASTIVDFCHPKDSKCPCCPLRVKLSSGKLWNLLFITNDKIWIFEEEEEEEEEERTPTKVFFCCLQNFTGILALCPL